LIIKNLKEKYYPSKPDESTYFFNLFGRYEENGKIIYYDGVRWIYGWVVMLFAGFVSGLLGIGSGILKVLGMDLIMNLPIKVSTTTINFMIGSNCRYFFNFIFQSWLYRLYFTIFPCLRGFNWFKDRN